MLGNAFRAIRTAGLIVALLAVASTFVSPWAVGATDQSLGNANPRIIPNQGPMYADLSAKWWQWAFSFDAANVPFLNMGGSVDVSAGQSGHVWFLAGESFAAGGAPVTRSATVPTGISLFVPIANLVNDYPCPDPNFAPGPGETLEQFLQRTGNEALPNFTDLFAQIDGRPLTRLSLYRVTSALFVFTADPALAATLDPCITGTPQPGVSVGYWMLVTPLTPGVHTLHFGTPSWGQDVTYILTVTPGR
jgi:hypothetical protein